MLIAGCGYIGRRLGLILIQKGHTVAGIVSSPKSANLALAVGLEPLVLDLDQDLAPATLPDLEQVFYLAPPASTGIQDLRLGRFLAALENMGRAPRLVYMGTTGVYGDCDGAWVDESFPLNPQTDRARRRVDAESQLQAWSKGTGGEVVILRVAGIYGPDRLPVAFLKSGSPVLQETEAPFSNRIQAQDLVTICLAAMDRGKSGEVYNVADGSPSSMTEYFFQAADFLGLPRPVAVDRATAQQTLSPGMLSYLNENRRIVVTKMLKELGVSLAYPDLESGLAACRSEGTS